MELTAMTSRIGEKLRMLNGNTGTSVWGQGRSIQMATPQAMTEEPGRDTGSYRACANETGRGLGITVLVMCVSHLLRRARLKSPANVLTHVRLAFKSPRGSINANGGGNANLLVADTGP